MKRIRTFISLILIMAVLTTFCSEAFADVLKLPRSLTDIDDEAFEGDQALEVVDIPWGTETIGRLAFANSGVKKIYIPNSVTHIANNAFFGTDVIIFSSPGAYAQQYAKDNGINWTNAGNYYQQTLWDAMEDLKEGDLSIEQSIIELMELNQADGITDQETLDFINDHNSFLSEVNECIEDYNNESERANALFDLIADCIKGFNYTESNGKVTFSYDSIKLIMDQAMLSQLNGHLSFTDINIIDDGEHFLLTDADGNMYYMDISGSTIYLSQTPNAISSKTAIVSKSSPISPESYRDKLDMLRELVTKLIPGIIDSNISRITEKKLDTEIKMADANSRLSATEKKLLEYNVQKADVERRLANSSLSQADRISLNAWHMSLTKVISVYENDARSLKTTIQKLSDMLSGLGRSLDWWSKVSKTFKRIDFIGILKGGYEIYTHWKEVISIRDHHHPTENDDTPEALEIARQLNVDVATALFAYNADAYISIANLILLLGSFGTGTIEFTWPFVLTATAAAFAFMKLETHYYEAVIKGDAKLHTGVYGYVYIEGTKTPIKDVMVTDGRTIVKTDASGYYSITISPSSNEVLFTKKGYKKDGFVPSIGEGQRVQNDMYLKSLTIMNREDLESVSEYPEEDWLVGADIDLSAEPWTPLPWFGGTMDGQGYSIFGLRFEGDYADTNVGLFNQIGGAISNLNITDMSINAHASGEFCQFHAFGQPNDLWNAGPDANAPKLINCTATGNVRIDADNGTWTGFSPVAGGQVCDATFDISITGDSLTENVLWNCTGCVLKGSIDVSLTGSGRGSFDIMHDCQECTAEFDAVVRDNDYPLGNLYVNGMTSQYSALLDNKLKGRLEYLGTTITVHGVNYVAENCEADVTIVSDNATGLRNCKNSTIRGNMKNPAVSDKVYARFIEDLEMGESNNTCSLNYDYIGQGETAPSQLTIHNILGLGSSLNTPLILEDMTTTKVAINMSSNTYSGIYDESLEQWRDSVIYVKTTDGDINIYSQLSTYADTHAESEHGNIQVTAASCNAGKVTGSSGSGTVSVNGGLLYNEGEVMVDTWATGSSYATGVYGYGGFNKGDVSGNNYGTGKLLVVGANGTNSWNTGTVSAVQYSSGITDATGVFGANSFNSGNVSVIGNAALPNSGWNLMARGVNGSNGYNVGDITATSNTTARSQATGCTNGTNTGTVVATSVGGDVYAVGVNSGHNAGEVQATTTSGSHASASGSNSGTNSGTIRAQNLSSGEGDAYADAQGGRAYASAYKATAKGVNPSAHSSYTGQTVTDGRAWRMTFHDTHDAKIPCPAQMLITPLNGDAPHDGYHAYLTFATAEVLNASPGTTPDAPELPTVNMPGR